MAEAARQAKFRGTLPPQIGRAVSFRFSIAATGRNSCFMKLRSLLLWILTACMALALGGLSGCAAFGKKSKIRKPSASDMADQSGDVAFQAFRERLRKAVAQRDVQAMAGMMTPNFGYSWEAGGEGGGVFEYWDRNNLWPELKLVLKEKFVPSGNYMVAPAEVTFDPDYKGYRAGLTQVNGAWRFAFFVAAPPASEVPAQ